MRAAEDDTVNFVSIYNVVVGPHKEFRKPNITIILRFLKGNSD